MTIYFPYYNNFPIGEIINSYTTVTIDSLGKWLGNLNNDQWISQPFSVAINFPMPAVLQLTTWTHLKLRLQCRSCQQMDHLHNQGKQANPKRKKPENLCKKYNKFRGLTKYYHAMNNFLWEHQNVLQDTKMFAEQYKDMCGWYIIVCAPK